MAGDYDLVVIGGGEAGVAAATKAARLQARVALVEQGRSIDPGYVTRRVLLEASRSRYSDPFSLNSSSAAEIDRAALVVQLQQWADATVSRLADLHAPAVLASLGVEVIVGSGAFYRKPTLGFEVNGRSLRSRHYFLAADSCLVPSSPVSPSPVSLDPVSPHIDGLQTVGFLDVSAIEPAHLRQLDSLVVLGKGPASVELSQALARLGWRVTLATSDDRLLPQVDPEAAQLIQAHLEAEGVRVLSYAPVTQVRSIDRKKWVQVGKQAIEADEILIETSRPPDLATLNLEAAQVRWSPAEGLALNAKLQTTNPHIYACTSHSHFSPQAAKQEAHRAIENALFPRRSALPLSSVCAVYTQPELAYIGLTEVQAQQSGLDTQILRQYFKSLAQAQLQSDTTGFCKLILRRNGTILGAHIVGSHASELISPIALAMQQGLKVQSLADLVAPSLGEIVSQTAMEWEYERSRQSLWQRISRIWRLD